MSRQAVREITFCPPEKKGQIYGNWYKRLGGTKIILLFYMGKNTPDRQKFIIENLKVELDIVEEV